MNGGTTLHLSPILTTASVPTWGRFASFLALFFFYRHMLSDESDVKSFKMSSPRTLGFNQYVSFRELVGDTNSDLGEKISRKLTFSKSNRVTMNSSLCRPSGVLLAAQGPGAIPRWSQAVPLIHSAISRISVDVMVLKRVIVSCSLLAGDAMLLYSLKQTHDERSIYRLLQVLAPHIVRYR